MDSKIWIVPSSLFVPGRLNRPIVLLREKEAMEARKAKLQAELSALPGRIADHERQIAELGEEYVPFKAMERG